eukprot:CAMPEP_0176088108 /NCGR_PEP_ID=MMETSP0120_2-20121206/44115_1 /TAXON_ID=160619 /ORGANISM="Kryptoperidinium foliaceum, Strain CCMP 1326" /LENGTH=268 /DNA_ID=CAMNT_0017421963 /DNA_START=6 /DNA_END=812 /DNA_ORIENTATION=-
MASPSPDAASQGAKPISAEKQEPDTSKNDRESDDEGEMDVDFDSSTKPPHKRKKSIDSSERSISMSIRQLSLDQKNDVNESSLANLFANSQNSAIKWQRARGVVGALEVKSEPSFRVRDPLVPRLMKGKEKVFEEAVEAWEDLNLREDFIKACERLPAEKCCCGLVQDDDATKRRFVELLNEGWCKKANKKLQKANAGVKIDTFLWNWQNASGKAETNIMLIRFFEMSTYRFRRASNDGSQDFELNMQEGDEDSSTEPDVHAPEAAEI